MSRLTMSMFGTKEALLQEVAVAMAEAASEVYARNSPRYLTDSQIAHLHNAIYQIITEPDK